MMCYNSSLHFILTIMQGSKLIHVILCLKKTLVLNKYQNHYYYSIFLKKVSYQSPKNKDK